MCEETSFRIAILPIGQVDTKVMQNLQAELCKAFPNTHRIRREEAMPLPQDAYNPERDQYNSSHILAEIPNFVEDLGAEHLLGVTEVDLYTSELNFVFGQAECPGKFAVISLCRLNPEFLDQPPNKPLLFERSVKEAVHEIGHTLGLNHCNDLECVMFFSNSLLDTDRKNSTFCEDCFSLVRKKLDTM
ncbi:archaemetzincin family Zn-dependent metalloprotease [Candidatus Bathyarchaeota archaeon]|nr:archaemetzincin family Zn-dependent metalloprotease [Candidatus Bathyarchaeota archaeon]NIU81461.1 archaemetzincin family Zn-dependent metalloprotease [Candidatus Bathyarchaeota archaeon]NIV68107.1 archaemetzincin family Zn-dependent metalloprotease [Candidatus Bathyarchaeota archaeon]NIW16017.1 archaemetzincin family Zn-dependent metalloprotease [Candidatus Bathyarchaeota archaeon]NIW34618.1 archaemetzincin family Zn-dependent metalloprotease [Candidatus Bathyarchaeota archaeon]